MKKTLTLFSPREYAVHILLNFKVNESNVIYVCFWKKKNEIISIYIFSTQYEKKKVKEKIYIEHVTLNKIVISEPFNSLSVCNMNFSLSPRALARRIHARGAKNFAARASSTTS